jgi:sugar phosphate permease
MTVVANWFKKNVGKALGIMACGFGASGVFVPLIVWLIDLYQWRITLIILGLGMWAIGIPLSFVIRDRPEQYGYLPDGKISTEPSSELEVRDQEVEIDFKEALKNRDFWYINIAEAIRMMIVITVIIHVMPYLSSIGMSRPSAALVATAIPLLSIAGRFGFGWLGDIFDKRYVMAGTFCLMGVGMLAFSYVQARWVVFPFLLFFSPAYGGGLTLRGAILREYFGRASFGRMLGIIMGIAGVAGIVGPPLAGWTFDTFGSYYLAWLAFSGLTGLAIVIMLRIKKS